MNPYLPAFAGFLGALLFALSLSGRVLAPGQGAGVVREVLHWCGLLGLAFATVVYLLALLGAVVFTP